MNIPRRSGIAPDCIVICRNEGGGSRITQASSKQCQIQCSS